MPDRYGLGVYSIFYVKLLLIIGILELLNNVLGFFFHLQFMSMIKR